MIDSLQTNKDKDRRNLLLCNDLARQYRTKSNELDIKHKQLNRIHTEFEQKLQQREVQLLIKNFYMIFLLILISS